MASSLEGQTQMVHVLAYPRRERPVRGRHKTYVHGLWFGAPGRADPSRGGHRVHYRIVKGGIEIQMLNPGSLPWTKPGDLTSGVSVRGGVTRPANMHPRRS